MAGPPPMVSLESLDNDHHGLRVEFHWHKDRYTHTIYRVAGEEVIPLLWSCEGVEEEMFPPSPCLVELHRQQQVFFLTGATSTCHWSLSLQAMQPSRLVFQVACRLKTEAPWLGSKYKVLEPSAQELFQTQPSVQKCAEQIHISPAAKLPKLFPATVQWDYVLH